MSENVASSSYSWGVSAESTIELSGALSFSLSVVGGGLSGGTAYGVSAEGTKNLAWAKHGQLETAYTLGDPDPFDKFVIQVSTDKRYGTPTFKTIGGASRCPGEPGTMWCESGMILQTEWSPGVNNEFLLPLTRQCLIS